MEHGRVLQGGALPQAGLKRLRVAFVGGAHRIERELVANPVQFDTESPTICRAPQFAEHTEDLLREIGRSEDEIIELKIAGAVT